MNVKHVGVIVIIFASLMWSIEPIFAKLAYQQNPDFIQTSAIRALIVTITALIYLLFTSNNKLKN